VTLRSCGLFADGKLDHDLPPHLVSTIAAGMLDTAGSVAANPADNAAGRARVSTANGFSAAYKAQIVPSTS